MQVTRNYIGLHRQYSRRRFFNLTATASTTGAATSTTSGAPSQEPVPAQIFTTDFTISALDSRVVFTRGSKATFVDENQTICAVSSNVARVEYDMQGTVLGLLLEGSRLQSIRASNLTGGTASPSPGNQVPDNWSAGLGAGEDSGERSARASLLGSSDGAIAYRFFTTSGGRPFITNTVGNPVSGTPGEVFSLSIWYESFADVTGTMFYAHPNGAFGITAGESLFTTGTAPFRVETTGTLCASASIEPRLGIGASSTSTGDWVVSRPQLERGAFASSYIPNSSATSTSRAADSLTIPTSAFGPQWNTAAGSALVVMRTSRQANQRSVLFQLDDGTENNRVTCLCTASNDYRLEVVQGGVTTVNLSAAPRVTEGDIRLAFRWRSNNYAISYVGTTRDQTISGSLGTGMNTMRVGQQSTLDTNHFFGHVKGLKLFNYALSNQELDAQTSPSITATASTTTTTSTSTSTSTTTTISTSTAPSNKFGPGYVMVSLANTSLTNSSHSWAVRWRAERTGTVDAVHVHRIMAAGGYAFDVNVSGGYDPSTGDYGTFVGWIADDNAGFPNNSGTRGTAVGPIRLNTPSTRDTTLNWKLTFPSPKPTVTAGTIYHFVYTNTHPDRADHYYALDHTKAADDSETATLHIPNRIRWYSDEEWAVTRRLSGGSWVMYRWTPAMQVDYTDGFIQGRAYMHVENDNPFAFGGTSRMIRSTMRPTQNQVVRKVHFAGLLRSGTAGLVVKIKNSSGTTLAQTTIPNSQFRPPQGKGPTTSYTQQWWTSADFASNITLVANTQYYLEFSCATGTGYQSVGAHQGSTYGYHPNTYFADGRAEQTTDGGASWIGFTLDPAGTNSQVIDFGWMLSV